MEKSTAAPETMKSGVLAQATIKRMLNTTENVTQEGRNRILKDFERKICK